MIVDTAFSQEKVCKKERQGLPIAEVVVNPSVVVTLASALNRYSQLSVEALECLSTVKCESIELKKNKKLYSLCQGSAEIFVVKKGWVSLCPSASSCRQGVCNIYMPGDLVGVRESFFDNHEIAISAFENCELYKVSVEDLHNVYNDCEAVKKSIIAYVMVNDNISIERLRSCTHHKAENRVAYLLLEIFARYNFNQTIDDNVFSFPITQETMGELLGITNVHVSRCMTALEQKKMIRKSRSSIKILQPELMAEQTGFDQALIYGHIKMS